MTGRPHGAAALAHPPRLEWLALVDPGAHAQRLPVEMDEELLRLFIAQGGDGGLEAADE